MSTPIESMSRDDVQRYIDRLIAKHELLNGKMNRTVLLLFGFAALYILVQRSIISQLNLGYFNLTDMQLVRSLIGPFYAASCLYFVVLGYEMFKVRSVLGKFMGEADPYEHNNEIMNALDVRSALLPFAVYDYFIEAPWDRLPRVVSVVAAILFVAAFMALSLPVLFTAYILWQQWTGTLGMLGSFSAIATSILFGFTLLMQGLYFWVTLEAWVASRK
ncbi:MAG: hypothetical protein IPK70_06225 [Flavobacteriales bacterium]|nr:hypothetical protein [Flavobacteriales bacterium]